MCFSYGRVERGVRDWADSLHAPISAQEKGGKFSYSSLIARDKMPSPSQLSIATSSVQRLVKEEASYHRELSQQQSRLDLLLASKGEDENAEFQLKQEQTAIEETRAVFPSLRQRIADALQKLEDQLEVGQEKGATDEEIEKAKEVIAEAKAVAS